MITVTTGCITLSLCVQYPLGAMITVSLQMGWKSASEPYKQFIQRLTILRSSLMLSAFVLAFKGRIFTAFKLSCATGNHVQCKNSLGQNWVIITYSETRHVYIEATISW
jgi:hypothetical protein